jgi:cell pole-organizing protein PopZ
MIAPPPSLLPRERPQGGESVAAAAEPLTSPRVGASVMSAFETLAASVVLQNTDMLDKIMRDLLRPMLKSWLDDNLPTLVERMVRAEIERVSRGGRG